MNPRSNTGRERLDGYARALGEQGIAVRADYVLGSDYYIASAYEAAARLIETDATAVFASSDNIALGLLKRLYAHDLRVPRDYSVVSYDNSAADVASPSPRPASLVGRTRSCSTQSSCSRTA